MNISIRVISILGFIVTSVLVYSHITGISSCPLFIAVPACYLILLAFAAVFISTTSIVIKKKFLLFTIGIIIGEVNGVWFSINEIIGNNYCPKFYDIPLCYVSCITFTTLIILKFLEYTSDKNQIYKFK